MESWQQWAVAYIGFGIALGGVLLTVGIMYWPFKIRSPKGAVQIVVLGDIGHSPRMQYHALSIARLGTLVKIIGYRDSEPIKELEGENLVTVHQLRAPPSILQTSSKLFFLLTAPLKVLHQIRVLWLALAYETLAPDFMLLQNPPSIPVLLVAILACRCRNTRLIVDWHNFGYTILAMKLGKKHPLVVVSKWYEQYLAGFVDIHFTVSNAMLEVLRNKFHIKKPIFVIHDRPGPQFRPLSSPDREVFLRSNSLTRVEAQNIIDGKLRLIVSSTSWTPDEDFSLLLDALTSYSTSATTDAPQLPELLVIITGKGPQKEHYLERYDRLKTEQKLEMITIKTGWLSFPDYAALLGAADLGVSLHTSSSGVDLPMKVVDMFGAGLPVLGYSNFKAWPELVQEDLNGKGFSTAGQLAALLTSILDPTNQQLHSLKAGAMQESKRRWNSEWDPIAGKIFEAEIPEEFRRSNFLKVEHQ